MLSTWGPPVLAEAAPQSSPAWEVIPHPRRFPGGNCLNYLALQKPSPLREGEEGSPLQRAGYRAVFSDHGLSRLAQRPWAGSHRH